MALKGDVVKVVGTIKLIGQARPFGQNLRANIKLDDGGVRWISLVSSAERVEGFIKEYRVGDRIVATCKAHEGQDAKGKPREELWVQEISKIKEISREVEEDTIGVDQYFIDQLKRAEQIARKAGLIDKEGGEKYRGVVAEVFSKIARHEYWKKTEAGD